MHQDSVNKIFPYTSFACCAFFSPKILPAAHFVSSEILSVGHLMLVSCLIYNFIDIENESHLSTQ